MSSNQKNALVELNIIKLELEADRDYHFRHTIDQWYCYENGYVTSSGKANPAALEGSEYVSEGWLDLSESNRTDTNYIIKKEHVIPLSVLKAGLKALPEYTVEAIREYLKANLHFATITKEEDSKLKAIGCNSTMPSEYYEPSSSLYQNPFARYIKAGIVVTQN